MDGMDPILENIKLKAEQKTFLENCNCQLEEIKTETFLQTPLTHMAKNISRNF